MTGRCFRFARWVRARRTLRPRPVSSYGALVCLGVAAFVFLFAPLPTLVVRSALARVEGGSVEGGSVEGGSATDATATTPDAAGVADADEDARPAVAKSPEPLPRAIAEPAPPSESAAPRAVNGLSPSESAPPLLANPPSPPVDAGPLDEAAVRLKDRRVFLLRAPRAGISASDRAAAATKALDRVLEEATHGEDDVRTEDDGSVAVVFVGQTPIVQLGPQDAEAAGDSSYQVHAAAVASAVRSALRSERARSAIANTVFNVSLVVFAGLIAFLSLARSASLAHRLQGWLAAHPERIPDVRIGGVALMGRAGLRAATGVFITVALRGVQVLVLYAWVVLSLSLFEATRDASSRVSGFLVKPLGALADRIGTSLPLVAILAIAALVVWVFLRFLGLFFGNVARRETWVAWLPPDVAYAAGVLARGGVVLLALLFAAPLVTGSDEGALQRVGVSAVMAIGLSAVPVLAAVGVGALAVFGRRVRTGDYVEFGYFAGRVREVTLLEVRLEDAQGCEVRVPHLATLVRPARILGRVPVASLEVSVDPQAPQGRVRELLVATARERDPRATVRLVRLDRSGACYRLSSAVAPEGPDLAVAVAEALAKEGIALGVLRGERDS